MTSNSNFKNFDFQKKKDKSINNNVNNNYYNNNNFHNKYNNKYKNKYQNKFLNKKETEEERLEREYQRRKFRESILAYDWSKTVPVVKNATQKELRRKKNDDKRITEYKTLSIALKSNSLTKKERIDFLRKKISFLGLNSIISRIKDIKILSIFKLRTKRINQAIQYLFNKFSVINYNKLFKKRSKLSNLKVRLFLQKLTINDIISLKEKINNISNSVLIQNINLFYYKELFSFFSFSVLKMNIMNKNLFTVLFYYIYNKYQKSIINKYYYLLYNLKANKIYNIYNKLKVYDSTNFDTLKLYPLSYLLEKQSLLSSLNLFKKKWRTFYLNKPICKVFFRKKLTKKKIKKYGFKKKRKRKKLFLKSKKKRNYFRKKFFFLNRKLKLGSYDDNREMTPSEISHQNSLKQALKKSVNKKDKNEMLMLVFKMKYPLLNNFKINLLLKNHLKKKAKLLKKFNKYKKKKNYESLFKIKKII